MYLQYQSEGKNWREQDGRNIANSQINKKVVGCCMHFSCLVHNSNNQNIPDQSDEIKWNGEEHQYRLQVANKTHICFSFLPQRREISGDGRGKLVDRFDISCHKLLNYKGTQLYVMKEVILLLLFIV